MRTIPATQHVRGKSAWDLRGLLEAYGIEGVSVRCCATDLSCAVLTSETRSVWHQNESKRSWAERAAYADPFGAADRKSALNCGVSRVTARLTASA
jgi:hypothetical protein